MSSSPLFGLLRSDLNKPAMGNRQILPKTSRKDHLKLASFPILLSEELAHLPLAEVCANRVTT